MFSKTEPILSRPCRAVSHHRSPLRVVHSACHPIVNCTVVCLCGCTGNYQHSPQQQNTFDQNEADFQNSHTNKHWTKKFRQTVVLYAYVWRSIVPLYYTILYLPCGRKITKENERPKIIIWHSCNIVVVVVVVDTKQRRVWMISTWCRDKHSISNPFKIRKEALRLMDIRTIPADPLHFREFPIDGLAYSIAQDYNSKNWLQGCQGPSTL